ncbi:hypothetical protein SASPL_132326 [Salvia splendens]|uniref:Uncharacterized protein n=1 Tax=Salvia splendens TaxID=180675 RepID=A0A8X8X2T6_SALSN|nr:uncharacterized protein LOC121759053 [Salvia splendens]KAG6404750.1 hypothetical protein SASPL_132326 [Salvia splendens]
MGRQNKDPEIVGSSIVLLQERFKQLQKLKEMREETQMLRLMPQETDLRHDLAGTVFSSLSTNNTAYQDPLALWLNSTSHHRHTPHFRGQQTIRGPHSFFETPDVDTSLHL